MSFKLIFSGLMSFLSSTALASTAVVNGNNNIIINGNSMSNTVDRSPIKTEHRNLKGFSAVLITGAMETELRYSKDSYIKLTAQEGILKNISTDITEGTLVITQIGNVISNTKIKAVVYSPNINRISLYGAGKITANEVNTDTLKVDISGAGDIELAGNVKKLLVKRSGAGSIKAKSLISEDVSLENSGVGDVSIYAGKSIKLINTGVADMIIYGNPDKRQMKSIGFNDIHFQ